MLDASNDSPLQLDYVFTPNPSPIRASATGANPNSIDLNVMISNPTIDTITIEQITIEITVGSEIASALSTTVNLPSPVYDSSSKWKIDASGSKITVEPKQNQTGEIKGDSIIFALKGILVNHTPGSVPVTITEYIASDSETDDKTYRLVKQDADFPITKFYADPAILDDYQTVTFYWECSDQGKSYVYSLYPKDETPNDCRTGGRCYSCAEGNKGVSTEDPLTQTTTFILAALKQDSAGHYSLYKKLETKVRVQGPEFAKDYRLSKSPSGRIVKLEWIAKNCSKCEVQLDGETIDDNAPFNTYNRPYTVIIPGPPDRHILGVVAHGKKGASQVLLPLPMLTTTNPVMIAPGQYLGDVAITPDSKQAVMVSLNEPPVRKLMGINLSNLQRWTYPNPSLSSYFTVAVARVQNKQMAYMPGEDGRVAAVDIASPDKPPAITSVGSLPNKLAISADGKVAVVMNYFGMSVSILDLVQFNEIKAVAMTGLMLASIAITPDGKFALVGCGTNIMIIDIAKQELSTTKIGLGYSPQVISITPNGQYALVTNSENSFASVIDIANLRLLDATIAVGSGAASIAHTREGRYALVANEQSNDLTLIDLSRLKPMGNIPVGDKPFRIAIAPDASAALLLKSGSGGLWRI